MTDEPGTEETIRIWTRAYRPFAVTGVHADIATDYPLDEVSQHELDFGIEGTVPVYGVNNPRTGQTFYIDPVSGGFLGTSLVDIEDDISTAFMTGKDMGSLDIQRARMESRGLQAVSYDPEAFWELVPAPDPSDTSSGEEE